MVMPKPVTGLPGQGTVPLKASHHAESKAGEKHLVVPQFLTFPLPHLGQINFGPHLASATRTDTFDPTLLRFTEPV